MVVIIWCPCGTLTPKKCYDSPVILFSLNVIQVVKMASFQKRSGSWRATAKSKSMGRITRTFDTKTEAEAWAKVTQSEIVRGVFVSRQEAENTTLSEALDRYEREVIPARKGAVQASMRIRIWKRTSLAKRSIASIQ